MALELTDEAVDVLRRSLELADVDRARGGIRLRAAHGLGGGLDIQIELADGPEDDEAVVTAGDLRVFVDPRVGETYPDAIVAVEPQHQTIVVRPRDQS